MSTRINSDSKQNYSREVTQSSSSSQTPPSTSLIDLVRAAAPGEWEFLPLELQFRIFTLLPTTRHPNVQTISLQTQEFYTSAAQLIRALDDAWLKKAQDVIDLLRLDPKNMEDALWIIDQIANGSNLHADSVRRLDKCYLLQIDFLLDLARHTSQFNKNRALKIIDLAKSLFAKINYKDQHEPFRTLLKILRCEFEIDPGSAKKSLIQKAIELSSSLWLSDFMKIMKIARDFVPELLPQLKDLALKQIGLMGSKDNVLKKMALFFVPVDLEYAKQLAEQVQDPEDKMELNFYILKEEARDNPDILKVLFASTKDFIVEAAAGTKDQRTTAYFLLKLAKEEIKYKFLEEAQATIELLAETKLRMIELIDLESEINPVSASQRLITFKKGCIENFVHTKLALTMQDAASMIQEIGIREASLNPAGVFETIEFLKKENDIYCDLAAIRIKLAVAQAKAKKLQKSLDLSEVKQELLVLMETDHSFDVKFSLNSLWFDIFNLELEEDPISAEKTAQQVQFNPFYREWALFRLRTRDKSQEKA